MSFPSSRTTAVETLLPRPQTGKRKHARVYQNLSLSWPPLPTETATGASRRFTFFQTLQARVQKAALYARTELLSPSVDLVRNVIRSAFSTFSSPQGSGEGVHVVLLPQAWALDVVSNCLEGCTLARIPPFPTPTSAPGGGGAARASMLASVGGQLLSSSGQEAKADDEAARALSAGDLSVLLDTIGIPDKSSNDVPPIVLTSTTLDQAVVDVVLSVKEALTSPGPNHAPIPVIFLAVCPSKERWFTSPIELRTKAKSIHFAPLETPHQEVDLLVSFLMGLQQPTAPLPPDAQQPLFMEKSAKKRRLSKSSQNNQEEADSNPTRDPEDLRVPLSYPAIQLVQAIAQLAPPGQALPRAAAALALLLQSHFTSDPLTAILPPTGTQEDQGEVQDMWTSEAYSMALARCIVAQNALGPEESAPQALRNVHNSERSWLLESGKKLIPLLKQSANAKGFTSDGPGRTPDTDRSNVEQSLLRYLFHLGSVVYPGFAARTWAAKMLAGLLDTLQEQADRDGRETGANTGGTAPPTSSGQSQALAIIIASLSPSPRTIETYLLKVKNGLTNVPPKRVQVALKALQSLASQAVDHLSRPRTSKDGEPHSDLALLRTSTATLPVAHTLQSVAQSEVLPSLIHSLDPFVSHEGQPLDGDKVVQQEVAVSKAAHWVWDCFLTLLAPPALSIPLVDAWLPSAAAVNLARRRLIPSPRADVQLALELPELALSSSLDRIAKYANKSLVEHLRTALTQSASALIQPDMAVAYQLMMEQPRIASLADWWGVFAQRVPGPTPEGVWTATGPAEQDPASEEDEHDRSSSPLSQPEEEVLWEDEPREVNQAVQARFTTALTALHDMGLLGPGARRAEHVARVVFDAPLIPDS